MNVNATLLGQMITFAIFVWFTMRVIWPLLSTQLETRKKTIADGLAEAEAGRELLATAERESKAKISEARQYCYKLLEEADIEAKFILEQARIEARQQRDEIIASGHVSIDKATKKAKKDLQAQVVDIAILGAEKILERSVTADDHRSALEELAKSLG